jgi:flagellar biosynthesis/type III secretory pathway protein FliH
LSKKRNKGEKNELEEGMEEGMEEGIEEELCKNRSMRVPRCSLHSSGCKPAAL